jgi:hypothetical protein
VVDGLVINQVGGDALLQILNGDLGLGIRAQPGESSVVAALAQSLDELGSKHVSQGPELWSLVGGITEHVALISGTNLLVLSSNVHTLSNVGALLLNSNKNVASLVVESCENQQADGFEVLKTRHNVNNYLTLAGVIKSDSLNSITDNLLVVGVSLGGDFSENHDHSSLGSGLFMRSIKQRKIWMELPQATLE